MQPQPTAHVEYVAAHVAEITGVATRHIMQGKRYREHTIARYLLVYGLVHCCGWSKYRAARVLPFMQHRTSVYYALHTLESWAFTDPLVNEWRRQLHVALACPAKPAVVATVAVAQATT